MVIDPGETVVFSVPLANSGDAAATAVTGSLASQTPGATVLDGSSAYADIPAGSVGNPNAGDTLSVVVSDTLPCGAGIDLVLTVSTGQGSLRRSHPFRRRIQDGHHGESRRHDGSGE